ncbi:hypothetical protein LTR67_001833 [Exophiala xenobiotica]
MPPNDTSAASNSNRAVKKRASQACHHCRTRKVKCDLVKSGIPCHNCESDGVECVVVESKRSRKYRLQKRQLSGLVSLPPLVQAPPRSATEDSPSIAGKEEGDSIKDAATQFNLDALAACASVAGGKFQSPPPALSIAPDDHNPSPVSQRHAASNSTAAVSSTQRTSLHVDLPSYIRPLRPSIPADDVDLLAQRGALSLPNDELRDQLLRCFVLYVYSYMPIIDLEDLFNALDGKEDAPNVSLTLFQAIMFAGSAFVDLELLQKAGYETRRAARADYYRKMKLLYDFDWDVDRLALIQSLLLANYWYVSENDQKDPWHWLGICISLATSIGLNQRITYHHKKDAKTCRLWRRVWWTCVMRDRIIAVSMRRPLRIKDEDINLPPLTLDDFDLRSVVTSSSTASSLQDSPFLVDLSLKKNLAEMCMAKISLLLSMGHIIRDLYHLRVFGGSTAEATMLYKPQAQASQIDPEQVAVLHDELDQWYRNLPVSCWLSPLSSCGENVRPGYDAVTEDALFLHKVLLRMIYLMATESLNRPQMLLKGMSKSTDSPSSKVVKEAAEEIADMVQRLQEHNLVRFLPPLSVSFMLFSLAAFLVEIKMKGRNPMPGQQFHHCIRALWQLRDIWPIADSACFLIGQMITKSQVGGISTPGVQPLGTQMTIYSDGPNMSSTGVRQHKKKTDAPRDALSLVDHHQDITGDGEVVATLADTSYRPINQVQPVSAVDMNHLPVPADLMSTSSTSLAFPDANTNEPTLYDWTAGPDFDHHHHYQYGYGVITNGHALQMDFAFDDLGGGDFQNNLAMLGFGPSPGDNLDLEQMVGIDMDSMPYPSTGHAQLHAVLTDDWTSQAQNQYNMDPSFHAPPAV